MNTILLILYLRFRYSSKRVHPAIRVQIIRIFLMYPNLIYMMHGAFVLLLTFTILSVHI